MSKQACPDICCDFELNRTACLLLNGHGSGSIFPSCDKTSDFHFHEIASAQLAVDCEIKQCAISHASFPIKKEADRPNLALFQRLVNTDLSAGAPSRSSQFVRIILCNAHFSSPCGQHWPQGERMAH
jgi:hypothetical protein